MNTANLLLFSLILRGLLVVQDGGQLYDIDRQPLLTGLTMYYARDMHQCVYFIETI